MEGSKRYDPTEHWIGGGRLTGGCSGMTLAELEAPLGREGAFSRLQDERAAGLPWPDRSEPFSVAEILAEIDLILCDLERLAAERPDPEFRLALAANVIASLHDIGRSVSRATVGVGEVAGLITSGWLLVLAGADERREAFISGLARARAAVADSERSTRLGRELHELVDAVAGGELAEDQFLRRLNSARPPPSGLDPTPGGIDAEGNAE